MSLICYDINKKVLFSKITFSPLLSERKKVHFIYPSAKTFQL